MCALPTSRFTEADYLKLDRSSEERYEFIDGEIVAMSGSSEPHARISVNAAVSLYAQIGDRPCSVYSSNLRVRLLPGRHYVYPDVTVVCGEVQVVKDEYRDILLNPTVIIEVLSPSTEPYDRGMKFARYRALESLQEYVLIAQDCIQIERYTRQPNNEWVLSETQRIDGIIALPSINCELAAAAVYKNVQFDADES
jgi:Uma2 family endonuclease